MSLFAHSIGFGLVTASLLAVAAVGLTLQFGIANFANIAYCQFMTMGAFLTWEFARLPHISFWLAVLMASIIVGVISLLVGKYLLGRFVKRGAPNLYLLIASFATMTVFAGLMRAVWGTDPHAFSLPTQHPYHIGPLLLTGSELGVLLLTVVLLTALHLMLSRTKLGKSMRAMADNKPLARLCGVPTTRVTDVMWATSGVLGSLGGIALAIDVSTFDVSLGLNFLFVVLAAVVLGGIGRPYGTMLGALIIGMAVEISTNVIAAAYKLDIAFGILILVLLVRPEGLSRVVGRT
jgi:branched-chain amino acid transport system permease protein